MLKIRRPLGRLIFNMGIAIPGKTVFLIETPPCKHVNTLLTNGYHFADDILMCIFLNEIFWILKYFVEMCSLGSDWQYVIIIPHTTKLLGVYWFHFVRLSIPHSVSALYLPQFWMDSFHNRHKWSLAWEGVSCIMTFDLDLHLQGHSAMTLQ